MHEADTAPNLRWLVFPVRPVLVTLLLSSLLEVSQHHDHGDSLLDDHLPEVLKGDWLGGDGGNKLLLDVCELDWGGIDIGDRRVSFKYACLRLVPNFVWIFTKFLLKNNQVVIIWH